MQDEIYVIPLFLKYVGFGNLILMVGKPKNYMMVWVGRDQ